MSEALVAPPQQVKEADPALIIRGVTKCFEGVTALREVDFDFRTGEVDVLFDENGAGKSTLTNIIACTFSPGEGTYLFEGA
ncbi:ATP-binding cassette domain-containing protein [Bradyrhizobium diazoefficiens]|uniref:ATP-binding cassette domain-containing protein n=1 Tax=Bradyrhizobium diazoefficiens TaxID=1355477 RepID=UPI00190BB0ED|nr:ATP-binding cassette domain-containing protein [Bradyrhizobium diazoefficiens]MBK3661006.1 ATP-binding cassette domain-containing protein [Bradyrhizobium diazoefficiens]